VLFFFFLQIVDTLNCSAKDNKQALISDELILLFLSTTNEIINNSDKMKSYCLTDLKYGEIIFLIRRYLLV
jgi:hypothetical protein